VQPSYEAPGDIVAEIEADPAYSLYWRRRSATQDAYMATRMIETREVWGGVPRYSSWPQVQAQRGPLPDGVFGIEFACRVPTDRPGPGEARWSWGPDEIARDGVKLEDGFAKVAILVTRCTQPLDD
jgi:hypothetical protein